MSNTVVGLFDDTHAAQAAVSALESQGFDKGDIRTASGSDRSTEVTGTESGWDRFLESIHLRAPQEDTAYYNQGVGPGQTLVSVIADDEGSDIAADILQRYGASNIDDNAAQYHASAGTAAYRDAEVLPMPGAAASPSALGTSGVTIQNTEPDTYDAPRSTAVASDTAYAPTGATAMTGNAAGETVIPIVEEQLQVGKRVVQRGGVRIYRQVTERPVEEQVTLREERVTVDRRPVDRAVVAGDNAFQERTIEMTEMAEEAVVGKSARVVEEVVVGKTATDRTETIRDTVRRTDVEVEEIDGVAVDPSTGVRDFDRNV